MKSPLRAQVTLCLALAGLVLVALAPPGSSTAPTASMAAASLSISKGPYVGGQAITFSGNIGKPGVRGIHLQTHMNRPNDVWRDLPGFHTKTRANGDFRFVHPAPAMFGIRVRVASGGMATPARTFNAKSQDLVLDVQGGSGPNGQVLAGENFSIRVDTTPVLPQRKDLPPPAFPGRTLTLQQRVASPDWESLESPWDTIATQEADQAGEAVFNNLTAGAPGTVVYRVRQENWTVGRNEIGWFPSFPTFVEVFDASALRAPSAAQATAGRTPATSPVAARGDAGPATTASQTHGWGRTLWDFAWEFGESLTSRPFRGTDRTGWWLDSSDGAGRANRHNGGLSLDSQRGIDGQGDRGSTAVTLRGNPMTYGRWEAKMRLKSPENNTQDYRVRIELVPNRPADYHCGAQNITVAELAPHSPTLTAGAKALKGSRQWTTRTRVGSLFTRSASFAVEVARNHISWFLDSKVIGTVRNEAAVSDVPMTLRLSLVGKGQQEMNRTQAISDWQRGFSIQPGKQVTSGRALQTGTHSGGC